MILFSILKNNSDENFFDHFKIKFVKKKNFNPNCVNGLDKFTLLKRGFGLHLPFRTLEGLEKLFFFLETSENKLAMLAIFVPKVYKHH